LSLLWSPTALTLIPAQVMLNRRLVRINFIGNLPGLQTRILQTRNLESLSAGNVTRNGMAGSIRLFSQALAGLFQLQDKNALAVVEDPSPSSCGCPVGA
jgi:hypothetical protein